MAGRDMKMSSLFWLLLWLSTLAVTSSSNQGEVVEEFDFTCYGKNSGISKRGPNGVILPRSDIIMSAVNESIKTRSICRFDPNKINATDVYFATTADGELDTKILNSSTIETTLVPRSAIKPYSLHCKLRIRDKRDKTLCTQSVRSGVPPRNVANLYCISHNNIDVNCTWDLPKNPVRTKYLTSYEVPHYQSESDCPTGANKTYCYWNSSKRFFLKDEFHLIFKAENELGSKVFIHTINVLKIVKPDKVTALVQLVKPTVARVEWNLTYPMDVFFRGLWHSVEYRLNNPQYIEFGAGSWQNATLFFHKKKEFALNPIRKFDIEIDLPHANQVYDFKVRIHTGVGDIKDNMWSEYDILTIMAGSALPAIAPNTSMSTFETVEYLKYRNVYVNFKNVDSLYHNGDGFHYEVDVFKPNSTKKLELEPYSVTNSYVEFDNLDFTEYRFKIFPTNAIGRGEVFSEVIVANSDCMPKKTEFLTVITRETDAGKVYSLYWLPSNVSNDGCNETTFKNIESYTLFWCKRTSGERCKNNLDWMELSEPSDLVLMDLSDQSTVRTKLHVKNLTNLDDSAYTFGIAANSGNFSSGIRWSSCIVDEKEPPHPPSDVEVYANGSRSVKVKWSLKCSAHSAVPLGFNVSYCLSTITDFGHCSNEVQHVNVSSPVITEIVVKDLLPGTSYIFSVALLSIIGEGRQSVPRRMILRDEIPRGPPNRAKLIRVTNTSITLNWAAPNLMLRNGAISEYRIHPFGRTVVSKDNEEFTYTIDGLQPFTSYEAKIVACTNVGCGEGYPARLNIRTKPGVPPPVDRLILDVSNWKLTWDLPECRSLACSFQVKIPVNESLVINATVKDVESVSLRELEVPCNMSAMSFLVRAIGQDESGNPLIGNWTKVTKEENYCPKDGWWPWWAIILVVIFACIIVAVAVFMINLGWNSIMEMLKQCHLKIDLPIGIELVKNSDLPNLSKEAEVKAQLKSRAVDPILLLQYPNIDSSQREIREQGLVKMQRGDSVSSEEVQLIDPSDMHPHLRNPSGSSGQSSARDSEIASSGIHSNDDGDSAEFTEGRPVGEMKIRQRSPAPPYMQAGTLHDKFGGYSSARSVPSLPHLYKDGLDFHHSYVPCVPQMVESAAYRRRSSIGLIVHNQDEATDVELTERPSSNSSRNTPLGEMGLSRAPGMPSYSRHNFSPKLNATFGGGIVGMSSGPVNENANFGQSALGYSTINPDPFENGLSRIQNCPPDNRGKRFGGHNEFPPGAYCRVGSRNNTPSAKSHGSTGQIESGRSAYSDGSALSMNSNDNFIPPYVTIDDTNRWAHPVNPKLNIPSSSDDIRNVASAPLESGRTSRVGYMPRPKTTEATIGHKNAWGGTMNKAPLSTQSSGYASQERMADLAFGTPSKSRISPESTLPDSLVMSPKRLLNQDGLPHSMVPHQASMV